MELLPILFTVSLLLNMVLAGGYALIPVVRKVLRMRKSTLIGMGPEGIDIREKVVKGSFYEWRRPDGESGDVYFHNHLDRRTVDGRLARFIDTETHQQVAPYGGICVGDDEQHAVQILDPKTKEKKLVKFPFLLWQRIDGKYLLRLRKSLHHQKMDEENGMWATIAKIAPLVTIALLMALIVLVGALFGVAGGTTTTAGSTAAAASILMGGGL